MRFDFSGVGESQGAFQKTTLDRQIDDVDSALNWLAQKKENQKTPIIALGRSFGGCVLLKAASKNQQIQGLCLWSTPMDLVSTFQDILGPYFNTLHLQKRTTQIHDAEWGDFTLDPEFVSALYRYEPQLYLPTLSPRPILILHGEEDRVVPLEQAKNAFLWAQNPKKIHTVSHGDHEFLETQQEVRTQILQWLQKHFP